MFSYIDVLFSFLFFGCLGAIPMAIQDVCSGDSGGRVRDHPGKFFWD
jgi:hypothetical protein